MLSDIKLLLYSTVIKTESNTLTLKTVNNHIFRLYVPESDSALTSDIYEDCGVIGEKYDTKGNSISESYVEIYDIVSKNEYSGLIVSYNCVSIKTGEPVTFSRCDTLQLCAENKLANVCTTEDGLKLLDRSPIPRQTIYKLQGELEGLNCLAGSALARNLSGRFYTKGASKASLFAETIKTTKHNSVFCVDGARLTGKTIFLDQVLHSLPTEHTALVTFDKVPQGQHDLGYIIKELHDCGFSIMVFDNVRASMLAGSNLELISEHVSAYGIRLIMSVNNLNTVSKLIDAPLSIVSINLDIFAGIDADLTTLSSYLNCATLYKEDVYGQAERFLDDAVESYNETNPVPYKTGDIRKYMSIACRNIIVSKLIKRDSKYAESLKLTDISTNELDLLYSTGVLCQAEALPLGYYCRLPWLLNIFLWRELKTINNIVCDTSELVYELNCENLLLVNKLQDRNVQLVGVSKEDLFTFKNTLDNSIEVYITPKSDYSETVPKVSDKCITVLSNYADFRVKNKSDSMICIDSLINFKPYIRIF